MIDTQEIIELQPNLKLHLFRTPLFKTTTIKAFIHLPLDDNATTNALLVRMLSRGCRKYPTMRKISVFLDSLYGAVFGADITKIGERHIIEFHFEFISRRFLPKQVDNTRNALNFLKQIIYRPLLVKGMPAEASAQAGSFRTDYFSQEQVNLKDFIKSLYDDKITYADERCIQEMCQGEPFRIYEYGEVDRVDAITPATALEHYRNTVLNAPMDIFVCGPDGVGRIAKIVADVFKMPAKKKSGTVVVPDTIVNKDIAKERTVRETQNIDQAKLVMGYRTNMSWADDNIFALMMGSAILGGFPHSKLFRFVREKAGLAYYAGSMLEKNKGLMFIRAGINHDKYEQALKIIKEQVEAIKSGDISDDEFNNTLSGIMNRLKSIEDSASAFIDYSLELRINKRQEVVGELKDRFASVTKDDIIAAMQKVKLDTVYFLTK